MSKFILVLLCLFTISAFADSDIHPGPFVPDPGFGRPHPGPHPHPGPRPLPRPATWLCTSQDVVGNSYWGQSYYRSQAEGLALQECERYSATQGCRLAGCGWRALLY